MTTIEIGSEFSYSLKAFSSHSCKTSFLNYLNVKEENCLLLNSGRGAIKFLFEKILKTKPNKILLPSYLCSSIIQPFLELGIECIFYNLDHALHIDLWDLDRKLKKGIDTVYFINYFGFPQPQALQQYFLDHREHLTIIEDCTHSLFSKQRYFHDPISDYQVASLRKWMGIPDGGMLFSRKHQLAYELEVCYDDFLAKRIVAQLLKDAYLSGAAISKDIFLQLLSSAEELLCDKIVPSKISPITYSLLNSYDYDFLTTARRRNFDYLSRKIVDFDFLTPLYNFRDDSVCPIGFPILLKEDRDKFREYLSSNKIYCPIHWQLREFIPKYYSNAHEIAQSILTIPCDQRYKIDDMNRIIKTISLYKGGEVH